MISPDRNRYIHLFDKDRGIRIVGGEWCHRTICGLSMPFEAADAIDRALYRGEREIIWVGERLRVCMKCISPDTQPKRSMGDVINMRKLVKIDADLVSGTITMRISKSVDDRCGVPLATLEDARRFAELIVRDMLCRYSTDSDEFVQDDDLKTWATDVEFHHDEGGLLEGWSIAVKFQRPWTPHRYETR